MLIADVVVAALMDIDAVSHKKHRSARRRINQRLPKKGIDDLSKCRLSGDHVMKKIFYNKAVRKKLAVLFDTQAKKSKTKINCADHQKAVAQIPKSHTYNRINSNQGGNKHEKRINRNALHS